MGHVNIKRTTAVGDAPMRGTISRTNTIEGYDIEIGSQCNCDTEMAAVAAHTDEILEFLKNSKSLIAQMLLSSIAKTSLEAENSLFS